MQGSFYMPLYAGKGAASKAYPGNGMLSAYRTALWKYHNSKGIRTVSKYQKKQEVFK